MYFDSIGSYNSFIYYKEAPMIGSEYWWTILIYVAVGAIAIFLAERSKKTDE